MDRYGIRQVADVVLDGTRARGVRLLDGTVIEAGWVVLSAGTYGTPPDPVALGHRTGRAPTVGRRPGPSGSAGGRRQPRRPCRGGLDCGYRTPTRTAPILHLVATFHSASSASGQAPDLCCGCPTLAARPAGRRSSRSTSCCSSLAPEARFGCAPWTQ